MKKIGYAVVKHATGEILARSSYLPMSPPPPDKPLGRLATFTAVGQEADGYRCVEEFEDEAAHDYQERTGETRSYSNGVLTVSYGWTDYAIDRARALKISGIKQAASDLILSRYPSFKQSNMIARQGELQRIEAGQMRDAQGQLVQKRDLTSNEISELVFIAAAWDWIKAVRTRSDAMEAEVLTLPNAASVAGYVVGGWPA